MTDADRSIAQTNGYRQKYIPSTNSYYKQVSNQQQQTQMYGNPYQQFQPHFAPCYTCGVYGHLSKIVHSDHSHNRIAEGKQHQ